jgi:hypothetical protein
MDVNVKVIGIAITEDELQKMSLNDIVQKALEAAQKELGFDFGISINRNDTAQTVGVDTTEITMKDKVFNAAMGCIDENGETTTLEIKNAMRTDGEWITQKEVSDAMQELFEEGHFSYYNEDNHRVYYVENKDGEDDGSCFCTDNSCNVNKTPARMKTDDDEYIIVDGEQEDGDWEVYYMGDIIYVDGSVTRSKARVIGSHEFDVSYDEVRCCRYHEE